MKTKKIFEIQIGEIFVMPYDYALLEKGERVKLADENIELEPTLRVTVIDMDGEHKGSLPYLQEVELAEEE
jgi:hypothetical protein